MLIACIIVYVTCISNYKNTKTFVCPYNAQSVFRLIGMGLLLQFLRYFCFYSIISRYLSK